MASNRDTAISKNITRNGLKRGRDNSDDDTTSEIKSDRPHKQGRSSSNIGKEPSAPSLQTIPQELRGQIFDYVATTEERIVLGWRMVNAHEANSTWTLDQCFKEAIALHPLSVTCRQFRNEFQEIHVSASEPYCILLVNNLDKDQLMTFRDYIDSQESIKVKGYCHIDDDDEEETREVPRYKVNLRLQMDNKAQRSAADLCDDIRYKEQQYIYSMEADSHVMTDVDMCAVWLGIPEVITQYKPRTTALLSSDRSMLRIAAEGIKIVFQKLDSDIKKTPDYAERMGVDSCHDTCGAVRPGRVIGRT